MILFLDHDPLAGEVRLPPEVQRFVGYDHEIALWVFTSEDTLHSFLESMNLEADYLAEEAPGQAPTDANMRFTAAQLRESRDRLTFGVFEPEDLLSFLRDAQLVDYIAVDPDTDAQQVWKVEMFEEYFEELD
jgi:hypothetical protein